MFRSEITADRFWRLPFHPLLSGASLSEFIVLNVEPVHGRRTEDKTDEIVDVELARSSDFGVYFHVAM